MGGGCWGSGVVMFVILLVGFVYVQVVKCVIVMFYIEVSQILIVDFSGGDIVMYMLLVVGIDVVIQIIWINGQVSYCYEY